MLEFIIVTYLFLPYYKNYKRILVNINNKNKEIFRELYIYQNDEYYFLIIKVKKKIYCWRRNSSRI